MNAILAGLGLLLLIGISIYLLVLATRLVKAVEEIANKSRN